MSCKEEEIFNSNTHEMYKGSSHLICETSTVHDLNDVVLSKDIF